MVRAHVAGVGFSIRAVFWRADITDLPDYRKQRHLAAETWATFRFPTRCGRRGPTGEIRFLSLVRENLLRIQKPHAYRMELSISEVPARFEENPSQTGLAVRAEMKRTLCRVGHEGVGQSFRE